MKILVRQIAWKWQGGVHTTYIHTMRMCALDKTQRLNQGGQRHLSGSKSVDFSPQSKAAAGCWMNDDFADDINARRMCAKVAC